MALIVCFPSDLTADGYILNFGFNMVHIVSCALVRNADLKNVLINKGTARGRSMS